MEHEDRGAIDEMVIWQFDTIEKLVEYYERFLVKGISEIEFIDTKTL